MRSVHGTHVVVAGAGLAGLAAAYDLSRAGATITLIDARDYAGGRVRTIRDFTSGQYAELGGEFVESEHTALLALCKEFGLRLVRVLRSGFTHRFRDEHGTYHLSRTAPWDALAEVLAPLVRRYHLAGGDVTADSLRGSLSDGDGAARIFPRRPERNLGPARRRAGRAGGVPRAGGVLSHRRRQRPARRRARQRDAGAAAPAPCHPRGRARRGPRGRERHRRRRPHAAD